MEATVVEVLAKFRADVAGFNQRVGQVENQIKQLQETTKRTSGDVVNGFNTMEGAAKRFATAAGAISAVATGALVAFGVQSFRAAARVEELDVALQAVGWSTGLGYEALNEAAKATRAVGIEMEIAQQSVLKFAQNNLDLAQASEVAKVAQDLAIIGGMNSTDTYNRLTHAIITGRSEVLKSVGIQKSAGQAYAAFAATLGKTTKELTYQEKQAAVLNLVLEEGKRVAGAYDAAMTSPGKVLRSFARITNELQVAMGTALTQAFGPMIMQAYELYKNIVKLVSEGGALYPIIQALGAVLTNLTQPIADAFKKASDFAKGLNGAAKSADEAKAKAEGLAPFIEKLATQMQRFLPIVGAVSAALAAWGGANLLKGVPIIGQFLAMLNPLAVAFAVLVALSPTLRQAFMNLLESLKPLIPVAMAVGTVIVDVLNVALHYAATAINALSKVITFGIEFVKRYATVFKILGGIFAAITIGVMAYMIQVKLLNAVSIISNFLFGKQTGIIAKLTLAWKKLNLAMRMNPIGFIIAAVAALAAGFVLLWNNSETFRKAIIAIGKAGIIGFGALIQVFGKLATGLIKIYTGPLKLLLKGLELLGVEAAGKALRGMDTMTDNIGNFFQDAGEKVKGFADKLDGLEKKRFKMPKFASDFKMPEFDPKKIWTGEGTPGATDGTELGKNLGKGVQGAIGELRKIVQDYKDFLRNEFMQGLTESAESARGSITKALDLVKKIFDEKAKNLKGKTAKKLEDAYWALDASIRKYIPQAEELGAAFKAINAEIENAQKDLEDAIRERKSAIDDLSSLLRQPFGEPSEIQKALNSANATVDSIINMYDRLVDAIKRRFKGIGDARRDTLLKFLETMTSRLVTLAKEREAALKLWETENAKLEELMTAQKDFGRQLVSTVKNYGLALFDVSKANEMSVVQAIKTSTGVVITAVKEAGGGLEGVQKQLRDRLASIKSFTNNIRSLLAKGLSKDYIKQLLEAGPDAAGGLAELLNTAGSEQISAINSLYDEIGSMADALGVDMEAIFYGNQVKAQQAIVKAAKDNLDAIQLAMDDIVREIMDTLYPLLDFSANLGEDIAQGIIDGLNKKKDELLALAQSIGNAIAAALASATAELTGVKIPSMPPTVTPTPESWGGTGVPKTYGAGERVDFSVTQNIYNPTGSSESATLVSVAMERALARSKRGIK